METQYLEMGMTSVVFACYKDSEGKPVVNWYVTNSSTYIVSYFHH